MKDTSKKHGRTTDVILGDVKRDKSIHIGQADDRAQNINTLVRTTKQMDEEVWIREAERKNARRSSSAR
jgi:hypothetical protein